MDAWKSAGVLVEGTVSEFLMACWAFLAQSGMMGGLALVPEPAAALVPAVAPVVVEEDMMM